MSFSDIIARPGAQALMPEEHSNIVLEQTSELSAVMRLARKLTNMSRKTTRMPVAEVLPSAGFIDGDNALIPTTEMSWKNKYIEAERLGTIVPIPVDVFDDTESSVWDHVRPLIAQALGRSVDRAIMYGENLPASFGTNLGGAGLVAVANAASHVFSLASYTDIYEAIMGETADGTNGVLMALEEDGFMATGHIAHTQMRGKLRNARSADGQPIFKSGPSLLKTFATGELDGSDVLYPLNGAVDASQGLLISGMWSHLLYAIRKDITISLADQASLHDAGGNVTHNLFQQDMIALRVVMRIGFALPNPINAMNENESTRCPFAVLTA